MSNRRMKRNKPSKDDETAKICQQFLRDKYEQHIRSDFIEAFGFFFCKKTMNVPFLDQELKTVCKHPIATNNTINYNHNEFAVYLKNILLWLDAKMKYTSNDNIPKGPGRILKVSHITSQEKVSRLCLYYQPQNFEEPNTLVCTQKAKPLRKENHFLNDNENLAIAGPSRIVNTSKTPVKKNPLKRKHSGDPGIDIDKIHATLANSSLRVDTAHSDKEVRNVDLDDDVKNEDNRRLNSSPSYVYSVIFGDRKEITSETEMKKKKKTYKEKLKVKTSSDNINGDNTCSLYMENVESSLSFDNKKSDKILELDKILNKSSIRSFTGKSSNSATDSKKITKKTKIEPLPPQSTNINEVSYSNNSKIQADKNMYARNSKGETKMHTACAKGNCDLVCSLLVDGFNPNVKDNAGWTPLHEAVRKGYLDIVNTLIKYGAFVNVPGFEYESPLHTAIKYDHIDIAVILLKHGADANHINLFGDNAQCLDPKKWSEIFENNNIKLRQPSSIIQLYDYKSDQIVVFPMKLTIRNSIVKHFSKKFNIKIVQQLLNNDKKLVQVSHIIVPKIESNVCHVNLECLTGIANGLFVVNENWISDSLEKCKLLDCHNYEVGGTTEFPTSNGARISRLHKIKLYPKLFDGINVHVSGNIGWKQFTRDNIKQLVLEFGAKLLQRLPNPEDSPTNIVPYHCRNSEHMRCVSNIVLYTEDSHRLIKYNMSHLKVFPISWFMEAIQKYSLG